MSLVEGLGQLGFDRELNLSQDTGKGQRKALSSEDSNILGRMRMFSSLEVFSVCTACDWTGLPRRKAPEDCLEDGSRAASQLGRLSFHQQEDALGTCWFSKFSSNVSAQVDQRTAGGRF